MTDAGTFYDVPPPPMASRGATVPWLEYEAETASTNGVVIGPDRTFGTLPSEASGRRAVRLESMGQYVEFTSTQRANGIVVRYVIPDSPAWRAGITFNDDIIAVDGARVNPLTFAKRVGDRDPGDRVRITYFRRDLLREATLTLVESPERALSIDADSNASKRAAAARAGWLGQARRA